MTQEMCHATPACGNSDLLLNVSSKTRQRYNLYYKFLTFGLEYIQLYC